MLQALDELLLALERLGWEFVKSLLRLAGVIGPVPRECSCCRRCRRCDDDDVLVESSRR